MLLVDAMRAWRVLNKEMPTIFLELLLVRETKVTPPERSVRSSRFDQSDQAGCNTVLRAFEV